MTPYPCIHRGEVVRQVVSTICGSRGKVVDVYECAKFTTCTIEHCKAGQKPATCKFCETRETLISQKSASKTDESPRLSTTSPTEANA